jgi:hypothetical protein
MSQANTQLTVADGTRHRVGKPANRRCAGVVDNAGASGTEGQKTVGAVEKDTLTASRLAPSLAP